MKEVAGSKTLSALRFSDPWLAWEPAVCTRLQAAG